MTTLERSMETKESAQDYGEDPLAVRESGQYQKEYIQQFVKKWDELIDWDARAKSESGFFVDILKAAGKRKILDVAAGTGFHSVQLAKAGFEVTAVDGSPEMLAQAFENAKNEGMILNTICTDWRWLNRDVHGKYDAIICLGNSFTHLHNEQDRRRALAEFYAALRHDGILIMDQRNYDAMLDVGFDSKHKYYYCGDQVTAEPDHIDASLARFKYTFPDKSEYFLNMFPLRKNYLRQLFADAGFQKVRTYGDFQETYGEHDPDFFIHVVEKTYGGGKDANDGHGSAAAREKALQVASVAEAYYDSDDADRFYFKVWGGEDIHIGLYKSEDESVFDASRRTVETMAGKIDGLSEASRVIDIGAGYGGSARYLAKEHGCDVVCLNISEVQNTLNRKLNKEQGLDDKITVKHGSFEDIPEPREGFDVVWSQDAILHSGDRETVIEEVARVLKPGGLFIFTDPMQSDDANPDELQPVYDRIHLDTLGSVKFYRETCARYGLKEVEVDLMTEQLRNHYNTVRERLLESYDSITEEVSNEYVDRMLKGLQHWVGAADAGNLAWGILAFRKED